YGENTATPTGQVLSDAVPRVGSHAHAHLGATRNAEVVAGDGALSRSARLLPGRCAAEPVSCGDSGSPAVQMARARSTRHMHLSRRLQARAPHVGARRRLPRAADLHVATRRLRESQAGTPARTRSE